MCEIFNEIKVYTYHFFESDTFTMLDFMEHIICPLIVFCLTSLISICFVKFLYSPKVKMSVNGNDSLCNSDSAYLETLNFVNLGTTQAVDCMAYLIMDNNTEISKESILTGSEISQNPALYDEKESNKILDREYLPTYTSENQNGITIPRKQWVTQDAFLPLKRMVLAWNTSGDPDRVNINAGETVSLHIFRIQKHPELNKWYYMFPTEIGWRAVRTRIWAQYLKGYLVVCPANAKTMVIPFQIRVSDAKGKPYIEYDQVLSKKKSKEILVKYA